MTPMLVTIKDGVVHEAVICKSAEALELAFFNEVKGYGTEPTDVDFDDGYIELEDATICMTWAESQ